MNRSSRSYSFFYGVPRTRGTSNGNSSAGTPKDDANSRTASAAAPRRMLHCNKRGPRTGKWVVEARRRPCAISLPGARRNHATTGWKKYPMGPCVQVGAHSQSPRWHIDARTSEATHPKIHHEMRVGLQGLVPAAGRRSTSTCGTPSWGERPPYPLGRHAVAGT